MNTSMQNDKNELRYTKSRETVAQEFDAAIDRCDLKPGEVRNTGYSLTHHEQATLAAADREIELLGAPLFGPTTPSKD